MQIRRYPATSPEVQAIIERLDQSLLERYDPSEIHGIDGAEFEAAGGTFVIGELEDRHVACGAFRPLSAGIAEVKRIFVDPAYRGRGLARAILAHLEDEMVRRGFETAVLETGVRQAEAIRLYRKAGYIPIPAFGEYASCACSLCFAKGLRLAAVALTSGPVQ